MLEDVMPTFGNLVERPDLAPFFGPLLPQENDRLLNRLLGIDEKLVNLAALASQHVGVPYRPLRLAFSAAGLHGGPSGDAGDIWFDVSRPQGRNQPTRGDSWVVESSIIVFCSDAPEPPGGANTHELIALTGVGYTPGGVIDVLEAHLAAVELDIPRHPRDRYTNTPHDELPLVWRMRWITTR